MAAQNFIFVILLIYSVSTIHGLKRSRANQATPTNADLSPFIKEKIVPDIIDTVPKRVLSVTYGNLSVNMGNELTPRQVKDQPEVNWDADAGKSYLLCFLDPDVPTNYRSAQHWLVGNIRGNDVSTGEVLTAYGGAGAPNGTGFHRYTVLLFEQPGRIEFDEQRIDNVTIEGRASFSTTAFAKKYNLGTAIAGNFFKAQYDDYVPILQSMLKYPTVSPTQGLKRSHTNQATPTNADLSPFIKEKIVPDIIDTVPKSVLSVKYGDLSANLGNELTPTQVKDQPDITWKADAGKSYLLCLLDPDATRRSFQHWLVGNIQGSDLSTGEVLSEYIGAGPPNGTGLHRYTFLLFEQPGRVEYNERRMDKTTVLGRIAFSIMSFAKKHNLGTALAGNFFNAQYDDYVPILGAQFKRPSGK